jgi:hypothetical protein
MDIANSWIAVWVALHVAALVTAYGPSVAAGSSLESITQLAFYGAMMLMGAAIWACQQTHVGTWGLSAVTLIAMVLTAVVDFRKMGDTRHVSHLH